MSDETDADLIADLLVKWEDAWDQGDDPSAEDLCGERTDLIDELRQKIGSLKRSSWMKKDPAAFSTSAEPPLVGILADRYRIEELVGEGGHGRVYRAFDQELERTVAIKVASTITPTPDLLTEARRVASLKHPNLVPVFDVGRHEDQLFVVSEFIKGQTLSDVIEAKTLTQSECITIIRRIADALAYAHESGFVHRDIKPGNILLDENGSPYLADFGIAASLDDLSEGKVSSSGTLAYMSPEQLANESQLIDQRTDIYSLGVVLFELLTGQRPYKARTPLALREQILFRQPSSLRALVPTASSGLEQVCNRALAKHPADRFQNVEDFADSLSNSNSQRAASRRNLIVGGVILMALAVIGLWAWSQQGKGKQPKNDGLVRDGLLHFDGRTRIVTNVKRTLPVTLEAWIKPDSYDGESSQFVIGSDIPSHYGLGIALCGSMPGAEYIEGMLNTSTPVPPNKWSHVAATFTDSETKLFLNGKLVGSAPGSVVSSEETRFVIGNVGESNLIDFYKGEMKSVRISSGVQYSGADFEPSELQADETTLFCLDSTVNQDGDSLIVEGEAIGKVERF